MLVISFSYYNKSLEKTKTISALVCFSILSVLLTDQAARQ